MIRSRAARLARACFPPELLKAPAPLLSRGGGLPSPARSISTAAGSKGRWSDGDAGSCVCGRPDSLRSFHGARTGPARVFHGVLPRRRDAGASALEKELIYYQLSSRHMSTVAHTEKSGEEDSDTSPSTVLPICIKVKRLDKTSRYIMNILEKEAVDKVKAERDIPDIRAGCIVELKVEAPENKGRISTVRGLVIGRRNAGIGTTIRVRRLEANIGVDTIFPLYSPNIKAMKVLERRSVKRAKLYYVRDRPFNIALKELAQRTAKKREMVLRSKKTEQSKK